MGLEQESSEFRDLEVGKIEPYEVSEKFERDTEEDVAVGDAGEEQSPKRLVSPLAFDLGRTQIVLVY
jgi:hypothetical protein